MRRNGDSVRALVVDAPIIGVEGNVVAILARPKT